MGAVLRAGVDCPLAVGWAFPGGVSGAGVGAGRRRWMSIGRMWAHGRARVGLGRGWRAAVLGAAVAVGGVAGLGVVAGCSAYITYPASEAGVDGPVGSVNALPSPTLQRLALSRVLSRDLASGAYDGGAWVMNPTGGLRLTRAEEMRRRVTEVHPGALLVGEAGYERAPVYSVTRVWVRGDEARVDVVRPAPGVDDGGVSYGRSTVRFRLSGGAWGVQEIYDWPRGAAGEPELFSWPEVGVDADADADVVGSGEVEGAREEDGR